VDFTPAAARGADGPKLDLVGGDVLRGAMQGELVLQTELGRLPAVAGDIERITPLAEYPPDLTVTLTDGRTIKGPLADPVVGTADPLPRLSRPPQPPTVRVA
jgi:hypothetical protein